MFFHKYKRMDGEISIVHHKGIFKKELTLFQSVAMITGGTIGAGVLGLPYAIAKVGTLVGLFYILFIGLLVMGLNLMIGEVAVRTKGDFQLAGLSRKYLGRFGQFLMTTLIFVSMLGVITVYIIGAGQSLSALFGGTSFQWSLVFFGVGTFLLYFGLRSIKVVDLVLSLGVLLVIILIAFYAVPHVELTNFIYISFIDLLFPYGVILFAFNGSSAVLESHSIMKNSNKNFKKAIIIAGSTIIFAYILFALATLGVTGLNTTEIATIGLGNKIGGVMFILGNAFAVLAMSTSFLVAGLSLKDSLCWDYKWPNWLAVLLVTGLPLLVFLFGMRRFIVMLDLVGGVFISLEMLLLILIYWKARQIGDLPAGKFQLHHTWFLVILLLLALTIGAVYSVMKLF